MVLLVVKWNFLMNARRKLLAFKRLDELKNIRTILINDYIETQNRNEKQNSFDFFLLTYFVAIKLLWPDELTLLALKLSKLIDLFNHSEANMDSWTWCSNQGVFDLIFKMIIFIGGDFVARKSSILIRNALRKCKVDTKQVPPLSFSPSPSIDLYPSFG